MWMQPQSTEEDEDLERLLAEVSQPMPEPRDSVEPLPDKLAQDDAVQQFRVPDMEQPEPQPIAAVETLEVTAYPQGAEHPIALEADVAADTPAYGEPGRERSLYPDEAPSDMAQSFYGRLANERAIEGDSEGVDFAQERLEQQNAAPPPPTYSAGPSPMWQKYSTQGAHMTPGSGPGAGLSALASRSSGGYGGPPMAEAPNTGLLALAAGADFLLNKGQNVGPLLGMIAKGDNTDYRNYRRQMQHAKDMAGIEALARRGTMRGMDPMQYELRQRALDLRERGLGTTEAREARLREQYEEQFSPDSATSARARELAVQGGIDPEIARGKSAAQLSKLSGAVNEYLKQIGTIGEARTDRAATTAGAVARAQMNPKIDTAAGISAATLDDKIRIAREGALARGEAEAQSPAFQMQQQEKYRAAADSYAKETDRYRGIAQQVQRTNEVVAKYAGKKDLPGIGLVEGRYPDLYFAQTNNADALEIRNAQRFMNDLVLRAQTGAAAPMTEQQQIQIMTGSKGGSTEAEFRLALKAVQDYATGQLRAFSAGKEDAARDVLQRQGIEGMVFPRAQEPLEARAVPTGGSLGVTTGAPPKVNKVVGGNKPRSSGAPKAAAQSGGQPIAYRNGKPVVHVEKKRSGDKLRVTIHYQDGSSETLERE